METLLDKTEDRIGEWMHTSSGGQFFPLDPKVEDIRITDIANGLALDCRYGGQGEVTKFYSVAEHSWHIARYARSVDGMPAKVCLAALLHDAPEAYLNDLPRAVKHSVGAGYDNLEHNVACAINEKYGIAQTFADYYTYIKNLDRRIVPHEKDAIMRYPQPWAYDQFSSLPGIVIYCFDPETAKRYFLSEYELLCKKIGIEPEDYEI